MLKTRIITAIVLLLGFLPALLFLNLNQWAFLMLVLSLLALNEWGQMIRLADSARLVLVALAGVLGAWAMYYMNQRGFHAYFFMSLSMFLKAAIFWSLLVTLWLYKKWGIRNKPLMALVGFVILTPFWMALVCARGVEPMLLLALLVIIWIADSAAYFAGKNFGKHKLAPKISPGKTWEGVAGALIAVCIFGVLIQPGTGYSLGILLLGLCIVTLYGVLGDLFESLIKRKAGIKDSGNLLPGHGGILDRIDGLIPSLPIAILMIYFFNYYAAVS